MMSVTSVGGNLSEMNSIAWVEGSHHGINGHVSVTKSSLHIGGYQLWFDLETHGLFQVYLHNIHYE